jgi:hypothetical protein
LEDHGEDGRIILELISYKWDELDLHCSRQELLVGCCECSNEYPDSLKSGEFLTM